MSLFDASAPNKVELKGSTAQTAPQYLTDYLTSLAQVGQGALGTTVEGKTTPFAGKDLIAELPQNLQDLYKTAGTTLDRYQSPMDESLSTLQDASKGVSASDISQFYNPYEQDVVNEMGRQSALNVQQSMLPALRAAFAGQGGFGSQRYAGAMGQAMGNVQSDLFGNQAKLRSEGYKSALEAALRDRGYDIQAGQALGTLGQQESGAATTGLKALGDIGTQELGYDQSLIEAPLTRAQNVAQIMRGYTYPTTTAETKETIPGVLAPSPLQQISGLGTLINAGSGKDGLFTKGFDWLTRQFGDTSNPEFQADPNAVPLGTNWWD
jgi:hypothetical protein